MISRDDLKYALAETIPWPVTPEELNDLADDLMAFLIIEKNEAHPIWQEPENPGPVPPVPEVESPTGEPPKPVN